MRIGVNTLFLIPGEVGGTETYLRETLKALVRGHPEHRIVLFTNTENDALLLADLAAAGAGFVPLGFRAQNRYSRIIREQVQLPGAVRRAGVDVLWSPGYTAPYSAPCPQVTTIHDMQYKTHPDDLGWLARTTTDVLVQVAVRRSARVLAVSEFSKSEIVRHTGIPAERVRVTLEAADAGFARRVDAGRARADVAEAGGPEGPFLLVVSNTYPHKNIDLAVDAFGCLQDRIPHALVLVGRPRLGEPRVEAAIRRLADPTRVKRISYVKHGALASFYAAADVFVFPSLYEGFGLPVLEAMMAGVPVVTGRFGSIPEVGGDACVYADSRSAQALAAGIGDVLEWDAATRSARIQRGGLRAATFSWSRTATQTLAALEEAVQNPC